MPINKEVAWFLVVCVGTGILENTLLAITNAWVYSNADLFYIPIFMPIFWGLLGTTLIVFYKELFDK